MNKPNPGEIVVKFQNKQNTVLALCPGEAEGKGGADTD
jgi:hypothetical protein